MNFRRIPWVAGVMLIIAGCQSPAAPDGVPYVGVIVARDLSSSGGGTQGIHVRAVGEECGIVYQVRGSTRIRKRLANGDVVGASYNELDVGREAKVWSGIIASSCPGQALAEWIELQP